MSASQSWNTRLVLIRLDFGADVRTITDLNFSPPF